MAFFLLFDLGVLVLNFYTSFKIDEDTVAINLSGRQRYVSQRIAKALFALELARLDAAPTGRKRWQELQPARQAVRPLAQGVPPRRAPSPGATASRCSCRAAHGAERRGDLAARVEASGRPSTSSSAPVHAGALQPRTICKPPSTTPRPTTSSCWA